jgi:hypothetical protein
MRKFILAALIGATILTPVAASAQERGQWRGRGGAEARQGGGERPQRQWGGGERPQRQWSGGERPQRQWQPSQQQQPQVQRQPRADWSQRQPRQFVQPGAPQPGTVPQQQPRRDWSQRQGQSQRDSAQQRQADGQRRQWQGQRDADGQRRPWQGQRDADGQRRPWQGQRQVDGRRDWQDRRDVRPGYRQDGRGDWRGQQARRDRGDRRDWSRNWRQDRRYDWGSYRRVNRNIYRLPRYYAPSGWNYGYRRFSIGLTLGSMLFSSNYWINDPFYYRLPPAYGPYRWVRYYNDALLVDIDTGEVIDVEYDIFW